MRSLAPTMPQQPQNILQSTAAPNEIATRIRWFAGISFVLLLLLAVGAFPGFLQQKNGTPAFWGFIGLLVTLVLSALLSTVIGFSPWFHNTTTRGMLLMTSVQIALLAISTLIPNVGIATALISILFCSALAFSVMSGRSSEYALIGSSILTILISISNLYPVIPQIENTFLMVTIPALLGIILMVYVTLLMMEMFATTINIKLISSALAIVLIPVVLLALLNATFTRTALNNQLNRSLKIAASNTAQQVDSFLQSNLGLIIQDSSTQQLADYLEQDEKYTLSPTTRDQTQIFFELVKNTRRNTFMNNYGILNRNGRVIYDLNRDIIGSYEYKNIAFTEAIQKGVPYISDVLFDKDGKASIFFAAPIRDKDQKILGVLRMSYDASILQDTIKANTSAVGLLSYPVLYDENQFRLGDAYSSFYLYTFVAPLSDAKLAELRSANRVPDLPPIMLATNLTDLSSRLKTYEKNPFFTTRLQAFIDKNREATAVVALRSKPWLLAYFQEETVIAQTLSEQSRIAIMIATLLSGLVIIIVTFSARLISDPITRLTRKAELISSGDIDTIAEVESKDEIGVLANSFNQMTGQLRTLINDLENRVQSRTQELATRNDALEIRSRQLQTISDVARSITSTQKLEELLSQISDLISTRFGFYHVGIFLLDDTNEYAVLRASNSEGGKRMLARQHKLAVGQVGIVGFVTGQAEPRITTDVGKDAVFFNNPDLPLTRSEMALPLKAGDRVIGALDVQSEISNAFSDDDIELFSILADQVAIAIMNNRLYDETARALVEMQNLHRQYIRQEWGKEVTERQQVGYLYTPQGVVRQSSIVQLPEIEQAFQTGQMVQQTAALSDPSITLAIPIVLRGETIGVIHVQENRADKEWNENEIATVQSVAEQIALALENARLFEQTVRRAERERKVLEITSKIRSTNDPKTMVRTALEELQRALHASRAQIILKQSTMPASTTENNNGNGHHSED